MSVQLADTRVLTVDNAKALLERIAHAQCRIASKKARYEKTIANAKSTFTTETVDDVKLIADCERQLSDFILANKALFESPRKMTTPFGAFGLRKVGSKLVVTDEEAAIEWALDNGYDEMVETVRTLIKDAAKRRIIDGEDVPGCSLPKGDHAFYTVAQSLLASAQELAEPAAAAAAQ